MSTGSQPTTPSLFDRIVVGVDGTEAGFDACRQAARLAGPEADVDAVAVVHLGPAVGEALDAVQSVDVLERAAEEALDRALELLGGRAHTRYLHGFVAEALLRELAGFDATLVALGTHGRHRATEILLGGVAGELLHRAPCSVLLARPCPVERFPRSVVVGHDGSPQADEALAVARGLEARFGGTTRVVVALAGRDVDPGPVLERAPAAEVLPEQPVEALVEASRDADLLVLGSRGLHGLRALGSVSERVAHRAHCSVLVVRGGRPGEAG